MKLLISAGEVSGDQRAAEVLAALNSISPEPLQAFGLGGNRLKAAGMRVTHQLSNYSVMGFAEILKSLGKFLKLEKELKALCLKEKPDCIILVDYPGFNMRLGRWARKMKIPVVHYIAPQMWAWGGWRVRKLKRSTDLLLTLFAFEEPFFRQKGIRTVFTGHPLSKQIQPSGNTSEALGLLPGSRAQEVEELLPIMLEAFESLRDEGVVSSALLAVSNHLDLEMYSKAKVTAGVELLDGTTAVLARSKAALVCSGTATLETALNMVPFVICYKTSSLTYILAKHLVRGVKMIGLANIIAGECVAPELIQQNVTSLNIRKLLKPYLLDDRVVADAKRKLSVVRTALGEGDPAENAGRSFTEQTVPDTYDNTAGRSIKLRPNCAQQPGRASGNH
ncbi:MAG: lipid-A-disaccharide synthase [bacterium]|nr:lipid-A-disaccharide synthase [bacterium]